MTNLEYLEKVKESEKEYLKILLKNDITRDIIINNKYRKIKTLEIIAETLIGINDKLNSLINEGKVINVDTHEV